MFFVQYKLIILTCWVILIWLGEACFKAASAPKAIHTIKRKLKNLGLFSITALISFSFVVPITILAANQPLWERPAFLTTGYAVILDLLVLDALLYWWHRANHKIPFLWRFHEVHHLDRFLDSTTALRFHFGEVMFSAILRVIVIMVLAVPVVHIFAFETLLMLSALFHHSNIRLPKTVERTLSYVIVTPSIHWVHHHAVKKDTDQNYATILSCWDLIFKTRSTTERWEEMPIGVDMGKQKIAQDKSWAQLLLHPFIR